MPKISRDTPPTADHGPVAEWREDVDGYAMQIVQHKVDIDATPMLKGLPGDHCNCPHWGYVIAGRVTFTLADGRTEVFEPGDAFYMPPGHIPVAQAGTEYVQFSPADELTRTSEAIMRNMQAMQGAAP
jgi:hypothetical protein